MLGAQRLLDNGWAIQLHKSEDQYVAIGINRVLKTTITEIVDGGAPLSDLGDPPHAFGDTPEEAMDALVDFVLFRRSRS